jgi:phosphate-selective porin
MKFNYFRGGYKSERNAPYSDIKEWEFGLEWQFNPQMELSAQYTITDRTNTIAQTTGRSYGQYEGHLLRFQFQMNY